MDSHTFNRIEQIRYKRILENANDLREFLKEYPERKNKLLSIALDLGFIQDISMFSDQGCK